MYFILKGATFPSTIGTITVTEGSVGSGGTSSGGTVSNYKFKVTATPSTATVKLEAAGQSAVTGTGSAEITVASGTAVKYTVSASGYVTKSATVTVAYGQTLPVTLNKEGSSGGDSGGSEPETPVNPPSDSIKATWSYCGISSDGSIAPTSVSNRMHAFVEIVDSSNATIFGNSSVAYVLYAYDASGKFLGKTNGFTEGNISTNLTSALSAYSGIKYVGVNARRNPESSLTASDVASVGNNFSFTGVKDAPTFTPSGSGSSSGTNSGLFQLESGAFQKSDGAEVDNAMRARSVNYIPIADYPNIESTGGYKFTLYFFTNNDPTGYVARTDSGSWDTSYNAQSIAPSGAVYYRVLIKNSGGTDISNLTDAFANMKYSK